MDLSGAWIDKVHRCKPLQQLILDLDSSVSETYGKQEESSAHNRRTDRPKSLKTSCWGGRNPGIGADSKITGKNSDAPDTEGGARRYNRQHSDVWSGSRQFQMGNSGLVNRKHLLLDFPAMSPQILLSITFVLSISVTNLTADQLKYVVQSKTDWEQATATANGVKIQDGQLQLDESLHGTWTSKWHDWKKPIMAAMISVDAQIELFDNKTIEILVDGSTIPFVDADGVQHDWYGRCMIAILDEKRWVMALRSGVNHISWNDRDAIHIITSSDEGRTWSRLNHWFDGSPIEGMPYEDGHCHSEPGLYRVPNGDLILQFWRTHYASGTRQLRSSDDGRTWQPDIDRIHVAGIPDADDDRAIGTEDWFIDPENPDHVYMAFQFYEYKSHCGTLLARTRDNGRSYEFLSWIGRLARNDDPKSGCNFEPAIEYLGNRTIVAIMRSANVDGYTYQSISTDMGRSFSQPVDISDKVDAGIKKGAWQRVRLYKDSNPIFQNGNSLAEYATGKGRLWGFGIHSNGGGYTRKPVVYWSDDHGTSWNGPESLHGEMFPGTDTGYGDIKRRMDGTFVAATYFATTDSSVADVEQYTFGGERAQGMIEVDRNGDQLPDEKSQWFDIHGGPNENSLASLNGRYWRLKMQLNATATSGTPQIDRFEIKVVQP